MCLLKILSTLEIIIVNWNSGDYLKNCLNSIVGCNKQNFILRKVWVVDNNSSDNSMHGIEKYELPLEVAYLPENKGFGVANNIVLKNVQSEFVLLLNPDTLLKKDTLEKCFNFIDNSSNSDIAIIGVKQLKDKNSVFPSCVTYPSLRTKLLDVLALSKIFPKNRVFGCYRLTWWSYDENRDVEHVMGSFMLIKYKALKEVSFFDENFFMYLEDLDLSKRIKQKGYRIVYFAGADIYHYGGAASERIKAKRLKYQIESQLIYFAKHHSGSETVAVALVIFLLEPFARFLWAVLRGQLNGIVETMFGYIYLFRDFPSIWRRILNVRRWRKNNI